MAAAAASVLPHVPLPYTYCHFFALLLSFGVCADSIAYRVSSQNCCLTREAGKSLSDLMFARDPAWAGSTDHSLSLLVFPTSSHDAEPKHLPR
jgi:hypothetical protein